MPAAVREYNLARPVQALCATAKVAEISYEVEGRFVHLEDLAAGLSRQAKLRAWLKPSRCVKPAAMPATAG